MADQRAAIERMFSAIAPRYDVLNRLLSAGRDRVWRREAVRAARLPVNGRLLDVLRERRIWRWRPLDSIPAPASPAWTSAARWSPWADRRWSGPGEGIGWRCQWRPPRRCRFPMGSSMPSRWRSASATFRIGVKRSSRCTGSSGREGGPWSWSSRCRRGGCSARSTCGISIESSPASADGSRDTGGVRLPAGIGGGIPVARRRGRMVREARFQEVSYRLMTFGIVAIHVGVKKSL